MIRIVVTTGMALALLSDPGYAQTPSGTPNPHAQELARAIVALDGDRARLSKSLNPMELLFTDQIEKALDLTDPVKKDKIGVVVHRRLQALGDDLIETKTSAMAQVYKVEELEGNLAFDRSPTGQALRGAAPELNRELEAAVFGQDTPVLDGPPPSEQKAALIKRILMARDVEPSARKGWRVLVAILSNTLAKAAKNSAPAAASSKDQAAEDAYVKRIVAVETQFYAKSFSEEQLTAMAAYFDGPVWQALMQRAPQIASIAANEAPKTFERQLELMDTEACAAVECDAVQRAALDTRFRQIRSMIATGVSTIVH